MTQVATDTAGTIGVGAATAAQDTSGAARSGDQQSQAGTGQQQVANGNMVVQREAFAPYGYDYHEPLRLAKYGRDIENLGKEYGMTPDQVIAHLRGGETQAQTGDKGSQSQAATTGFDPDQLAEKAATTALERLDQRRQAEAQTTEAAQRQAYYATREPAIKAIQTDLLKQLDIKPQDHRAPIIGTIAETAARNAIIAGLKADKRFAGMDDATLASIAAQEPPKEEEAKAALEAAVKMYQDLGNEFLASGVKAQAGLPGGTLGDGPGGAKGQPTAAEIAKWPKEKYAHYIARGEIVG